MINTATDDRRHNFTIIDNEVITDYKLTPHEGWLYVVIASYINQKTGVAFPSLTTLADQSSMTKPTVVKHLKALQDKGLIDIIPQLDKETGAHKSNHYRLVGVVKQFNKGGKIDLQAPVKQFNTNHTKPNKTNEPEQKPSNADPVDTGQHKPAFEYPIGSTLYYVEEPQNQPAIVHEVLITAQTKKKVWVEDGDFVRCVYEHSLKPEPPKLERQTDALQDVLAYRSFGIPKDAKIGKQTMYTLVTLKTAILAAHPDMTPELLDSIYHNAGISPSLEPSILAMINRFMNPGEPTNDQRSPQHRTTGRTGQSARNGRGFTRPTPRATDGASAAGAERTAAFKRRQDALKSLQDVSHGGASAGTDGENGLAPTGTDGR